ncbi:MAG TPA: M20/M25/M40 family metallo-hydrolase [bacterium]|nr:M20/M25/M40 family metallo-hydrolase [bacterium]
MTRRNPAAARATVAVLLLAAGVALFAAPATLSAPAAPGVPAVSQGSAEATLEHLKVLSQSIGPRAAGSAGDQKAIEYVAREFEALGYTVQRQSFPFHYFEEVQAPVLTVLGAAAERISPFTMLYSTSTPEAGLEAEVVAAGLGRREDFEGRQVNGRIALVERGQIFFSEKVANAASAGAVAVLIYNNQPGPPAVGTLAGPSRIPAVAISRDDGQSLLRRSGTGPVRARLVVRTISEQRTSFNVIGVKRGATLPGEVVVVGGHRDSVSVSPGANDNASGIAATLEAARLLARTRPVRTLHFVAFGAEELGLYGSRFYAQNPPGTIVGMINMDMVGRGPLQVGNSNDDNRLVELAERMAHRLGLRVTRFKLRGSSSSDHASFESAGIPTAFIHTGDDPVIHTPNDTLERVDPALVAQAATLAAQLALEAAGPVR